MRKNLLHKAYIIFLFFTVLFFSTCQRGEQKLAGLYTVFDQIDSLNMAHELSYNYTKEKLTESDSLLQLSKTLNYKKGEIDALCNILSSHIRHYENEDIVRYCNAYHAETKTLEDDGLRAKLLLKMGRAEYGLNDLNAALDYTLQAKKIYIKLENNIGLSESLALEGLIHHLKSNRPKAKVKVKEALALATEIGFDRGIARGYQSLGNLLLFSNPDTALFLYKKARKINEKMQYTDFLVANLMMVAVGLSMSGKLEEAGKMLRETLVIADSANDTRIQSYAQFNLAMNLEDRGQKEEALQKLFQARDSAAYYKHADILASCYEELYLYYAERGENELALENYIQYDKISDSLAIVNNGIEMLKTELKHESEREKIETSSQNSQFILILCLLGTLLLFGAYVIFQKYKKQVLNIENKQRENQLLKEQLDAKDRELTSSIIYQIRLNESKKEIADYLINEKKKFSSSYYPILDKAIERLKKNDQEKVWEEFELRFNQLHQSFFQNLSEKFPDITTNEKRLCAFLVMNMNTKEISALTGQSERAIQQARTRLRKKIGLTGSKINISNFLSKV